MEELLSNNIDMIKEKILGIPKTTQNLESVITEPVTKTTNFISRLKTGLPFFKKHPN